VCTASPPARFRTWKLAAEPELDALVRWGGQIDCACHAVPGQTGRFETVGPNRRPAVPGGGDGRPVADMAVPFVVRFPPKGGCSATTYRLTAGAGHDGRHTANIHSQRFEA
jgi:hypothetical protein